MINVSAISVNAGLGQSSTIQGRGQGPAGDAASGQGFAPLAGFDGGQAGFGGSSSAPVAGQGFGGAAQQGGDGLLVSGDSGSAAHEGQIEGQAPQPLVGGALAGAAVDAATLQSGYGAPTGASVETGASAAAGFAGMGADMGAGTASASGDSGRGFAGSGLAIGSAIGSADFSSRAGLDGLQLVQARVHSQGQSQGHAQGQAHQHSPALSQSQVQNLAQHQAQTGSQELARAMASLIGNGGSQAAALRGAADGAALVQAAQGSQVENPLLAAGGARTGAVAIPEWSPVKVDVQQAHWGRDLMAALAERVEMQLSQEIKQARIRLDPPELGRLQLTVRLDGDRLSVQFNASHAQVREALAHQQDRLRADLAGEYGQGVEVSVGQEQGQQRSPAGDLLWDTPEVVAEIGSLAVEGDLDGSEAGPGRAVSSPGDKDWVSALA